MLMRLFCVFVFVSLWLLFVGVRFAFHLFGALLCLLRSLMDRFFRCLRHRFPCFLCSFPRCLCSFPSSLPCRLSSFLRALTYGLYGILSETEPCRAGYEGA